MVNEDLPGKAHLESLSMSVQPNGDKDPFEHLRTDPELSDFRFFRDQALRFCAEMRDNSGPSIRADSTDELADECRAWLDHAREARDQAQRLARRDHWPGGNGGY
jgi:hypothetical protein